MDFFLAGVGHLNFAISFFIGAKILMLKAKHRSRPGLRYAVSFGLLAILCTGLPFSDPWQKQYLFGFPYITSTVLGLWGIFAVFFLHEVGLWRGIYGIAGGLMFQFAINAPSKMITMFNGKENPFYLTLPLTIIIALAYGGFLLYTTRRDFVNPESFRPGPSTTIITAILAASISQLPLLEDACFQWQVWSYVLLMLLELLLSMMSIGIEMTAYGYYQKQLAEEIARQIHQREDRNFDAYQEVIHHLNVKIHDLKHQIRDVAQKEVDPDYAKRLNELVSEYDAFIKTGNETVDLILTEKSYLCKGRNIDLRVMMDGKSLSFLSPYEINSLLGNLLDNAIESLSKEENVDKRYIMISTKSRGDATTLLFENYCSHEVKIGKNGLPETKKDQYYHGFGMQSVRDIARKYEGDIRCYYEPSAFHCDLVLMAK